MKNNNCYYRFLLPIILCVVSVNLHAQSDSLLQNSDLKRHNFRLAIEGGPTMLLEKKQLQTMLSEEQFRSYKVARNCYIASIPLLSLGAGFFILGKGIALNIRDGFDFGRAILADIATLMGITFIISGATLIICSAVKLNNIAKKYNKQRHHSYFQNGLQLNYGFVGNGVGFQLRF